MIRVWDKDHARAGNLGFESLCLILRKAQESRCVGNVEDGQHRNVDVSVLLLAVEDCHDYGIVRRVRRRERGKILYSLLEFPLQLPSLGKHLRQAFRAQMKRSQMQLVKFVPHVDGVQHQVTVLLIVKGVLIARIYVNES